MDRSTSLGTRITRLLLAVALLCASTLLLAAQDDELSVKVVGKAQSGAAARLLVSGIWPVACTPELDATELRGQDLTVRLRVTATGCLPQATAFTLLVEHPSLEWPEAQVLRLRLERVDAQGDVHLIGFRLIEVGSPERVNPETGFWWNERGGEFDTAGPGQSILIEPQGDRLGVAVMGYAKDRRSTWYFGAGPLQQRSSEVSLLTLDGGGGPLQDYRQPDDASPAAALWLEFHNASRATAWFVIDSQHGGIELRPQSLVRFRFGDGAPQSWEGLWVVESTSGKLLAANFVLADSQAGGFVLVDADNQLWLDCVLSVERPNSPPEYCDLLGVDDEPIGRFHDVGLGRMLGKHADGDRLNAVRMSLPSR
jgi:hypothetical protein